MSKTMLIFILAIMLVIVISANAHMSDQPQSKMMGDAAVNYRWFTDWILEERGYIGYFFYDLMVNVYYSPNGICFVMNLPCG